MSRDPLPFPPKNRRRIMTRINRIMARLPDVVSAEDDSHDLRMLSAYWRAYDALPG